MNDGGREYMAENEFETEMVICQEGYKPRE